MSNFVLYILMFGLGALWMRLKCSKIYNSEVWKAKEQIELAKLHLEAEKYRTRASKLLDQQISSQRGST